MRSVVVVVVYGHGVRLGSTSIQCRDRTQQTAWSILAIVRDVTQDKSSTNQKKNKKTVGATLSLYLGRTVLLSIACGQWHGVHGQEVLQELESNLSIGGVGSHREGS